MADEELTGDRRCWPCTLANLAVGGVVGLLPLALVWGQASTVQFLLAAGWAASVLGFTLYRIVAKGYLPAAGTIARVTGLHERIGPGGEAGQSRQDREAER